MSAISKVLRRDMRRTYSDRQSPQTAQDDTQARWSRFREAVKGRSPSNTMAELEAAWNATATTGQLPPLFKIGDRVRVVTNRYGEDIAQLVIGTEGKLVEYDATGGNDEECRACWRVWTDEGGRPCSGWHAPDELELVS